LTRARAARAIAALAIANARYWPTVAPLVRAQLKDWEARARLIPDPSLRACAIEQLRTERFNVELAATLATLAPRAARATVTRAIVALQVMYDYVDTLTEQAQQAAQRSTRDRHSLYEALPDAVAKSPRPKDHYRDLPNLGDGGYLQGLLDTVAQSLARLPAIEAIHEVARRGAARCAAAQALSHASKHPSTAEVERLAAAGGEGGAPLQGPELLAGAAASVLALHALIAAAADTRTTRSEAQRIDAAYLRIAALTMLDSLIDRERDRATGQWGYAECYESAGQMAARLARVAREATAMAGKLRHAGHHAMTLAGVVAYYASAAPAREPFARPVFCGVCAQLRPLIVPTLAVMRGWRLAKSAHRRVARPNRARADRALL